MPAGSTDTSLWTHYKNGARQYCGNAFPDGMAKNQRLAANVITPTTKSETHDVPISSAEIVAQVCGRVPPAVLFAVAF
jgi:phosphoribosylaminoimidazole-succinocarboxamide synthase